MKMRLALKLGADPNFSIPKGDTPLTMIAGGNDDELLLILLERADYDLRDSGESSIAWQIHNGLPRKLLSPEYPAYGWALKVKQQLIDRGVTFPPLSPREVRWQEGKPNRWDIKAREK